MPAMKRLYEVIDDYGKIQEGCKKHCKKLQNCMAELKRAIRIEADKIETIQHNNDLRGMRIEELAGPVIRMRAVADKMQEAFFDMKQFIADQEASIKVMERTYNEDEVAIEDEDFERENRQDEIRQQRQVERDEMEAEQRQAVEFDDSEGE